MERKLLVRRRSPRGGRGSEHQALERLQAQLTLGAWCIGGVAGLLAHVGGSDLNPLLGALLGLLLVVLAGICGGGLGFFLHFVMQRRRGKGESPDHSRDQGRDHGPDPVGAVALGSATGAFLGLVAALSLGAWEQAPLIVAVGAGVLSLVFSLAGRLGDTMLRMLVLDSRRARRDAEQAEQEDAAGKDRERRDQDLLR